MAEDEMPLPEAARLFRISERTLRQAADRGSLCARRLGRWWVVTPAAVAEWIAGPHHRRGRPAKAASTDGAAARRG